jgi:glycosyltransferase involved in cell wall biosynthesis
MEFKDNAKALFKLAGENCMTATGIEYFSWSMPAVDALGLIFSGGAFPDLVFEAIESKEEVVHLVYYYYLRRLADPAAFERLCSRERAGLVEHCQAAILRSEEYALHGRAVFSIEVVARPEQAIRIFVDVTNTSTTKARTGIQRVVRELSRELGSGLNGNVAYVAYVRDVNRFRFFALVDDEFVALDKGGEVIFNKGDIYFDADGSWGDAVPRFSLYRQLRGAGVRILNIHYDAAPILFPMYSHPITVLRFLEHFFAASNFSDKFLCISEAVERDYINIARRLNSRIAPTTVIPLGNVFSALSFCEEEIPATVVAFSEQRFVLFVGTVEPRKNYSLLIDNLDRFEQLGLKVILVGKKGWESAEVVAALEASEAAGNFLWLRNASDGVLRRLYEKCYVYASVAHYEGYGLPVLEALSYGCAVVTSDGGALEEVGRGFALSFALADSDGFAKTMECLVADPECYKKLKGNVANYHAPEWKDSILTVNRVLEYYLRSNEVSLSWRDTQLVYISIRPDSLRRSLASFIKYGHEGAVVVLTSSTLRSDIETVLTSLDVMHSVLCDEDLFAGEVIPTDHQERNFQLRSRLYDSPIVENIFLSLDDDAILLNALQDTHYVDVGKYSGYYFYSSMANWNSSPFGITSYDEGQWRTASLLLAYSYGDKSFSAHQPQIIDKHIVREIYTEYAGCVAGGVDEWSLYFNVGMARYCNKFSVRAVTTLNWPEDYSAWLPGWFSNEVHYMNYYPGTSSGGDDVVSLLKYSSAYDKYHAQRIIGSVAGSVSFSDVEFNMVAGLPGIWVDIKVEDPMSGVGYRICSGGAIIVDGSRDVQSISVKSPLKLKMPAEPGTYQLHVFYVEDGKELTSASVMVFPWRKTLVEV